MERHGWTRLLGQGFMNGDELLAREAIRDTMARDTMAAIRKWIAAWNKRGTAKSAPNFVRHHASTSQQRVSRESSIMGHLGT
jgi:hypothetical protein